MQIALLSNQALLNIESSFSVPISVLTSCACILQRKPENDSLKIFLRKYRCDGNGEMKIGFVVERY